MKENMMFIYEGNNKSSDFSDFILSLLKPKRVAIRGDKSVDSENSLREIEEFFDSCDNFKMYSKKQEKAVGDLSLLDAIVLAHEKQKTLDVVCYIQCPGSHIQQKLTMCELNKKLLNNNISTAYKHWAVSWYE